MVFQSIGERKSNVGLERWRNCGIFKPVCSRNVQLGLLRWQNGRGCQTFWELTEAKQSAPVVYLAQPNPLALEGQVLGGNKGSSKKLNFNQTKITTFQFIQTHSPKKKKVFSLHQFLYRHCFSTSKPFHSPIPLLSIPPFRSIPHPSSHLKIESSCSHPHDKFLPYQGRPIRNRPITSVFNYQPNSQELPGTRVMEGIESDSSSNHSNLTPRPTSPIDFGQNPALNKSRHNPDNDNGITKLIAELLSNPQPDGSVVIAADKVKDLLSILGIGKLSTSIDKMNLRLDSIKKSIKAVTAPTVSLLLCKRQANIVTKVTKDITKYR
jgi:hypothetical protein